MKIEDVQKLVNKALDEGIVYGKTVGAYNTSDLDIKYAPNTKESFKTNWLKTNLNGKPVTNVFSTAQLRMKIIHLENDLSVKYYSSIGISKRKKFLLSWINEHLNKNKN